MATTGPLVPHSESARSYHVRDDYLRTPRYHAEIKFRTPQRGPLVIGRGRFVGLGLMMPATGEVMRQTQESLAPRQSQRNDYDGTGREVTTLRLAPCEWSTARKAGASSLTTKE